MSPALSILNRELCFLSKTDIPADLLANSPLLWGSRGPLGYAFGRETEPFNCEVKNYLRKTTKCISVGISLLNAVISVVFSANYTQTLHHSDSSAPYFESKRAQNYKKQLKDESRNQTR